MHYRILNKYIIYIYIKYSQLNLRENFIYIIDSKFKQFRENSPQKNHWDVQETGCLLQKKRGEIGDS